MRRMILEIIDTNRIKYRAATWIKDRGARQLEADKLRDLGLVHDWARSAWM